MKALRRSITATLLVLVSATAAQAECAWIIWEELTSYARESGGSGPHYSLSRATQSRAECDVTAKLLLDDREDTLKRIARGPTGSNPVSGVTNDGEYAKSFFPNGGFVTYRYLCLPDTIDPRGPKAK